MRVIGSERVPIKMWLPYLEDGAEAQAKNLANLPFTFKHVAIMPDAHQGYGMPIGGVLATDGVIIPNAVGVDIGCGMCAVRTNLNALNVEREAVKRVMGKIRETVPVGFGHHAQAQDQGLMPTPRVWDSRSVVYQQYDNALTQLGTLGGGNHFIEIQVDPEGTVWLMIHSGSRNFGLKVAARYNELAVALNEKWRAGVPKSWELAFLPLDSKEGQAYLAEMNYCVEFALANRKLMMQRVVEALTTEYPTVTPEQFINIAHNYAAMENHFGKNVLVHRKGATRAREGELGIIPGSQGTKSYIVRGRGNAESFQSCSHGAGRRLSRAKARATLSLEDEVAKLDAQGIIHGIRGQKDLDEAAGAYKDIDEVMVNQADLVEVVTELRPIAVIKG